MAAFKKQHKRKREKLTREELIVLIRKALAHKVRQEVVEHYIEGHIVADENGKVDYKEFEKTVKEE